MARKKPAAATAATDQARPKPADGRKRETAPAQKPGGVYLYDPKTGAHVRHVTDHKTGRLMTPAAIAARDAADAEKAAAAAKEAETADAPAPADPADPSAA